MASAKEAIVLCLDVGPSMCQAPQGQSSKLETSVKAINMIVSRKMFSQGHLVNKDEFALILFGTQDSDNELYEEGQYENVSVVRPLGPPDLNFLRYIQTNITPNGEEADFIDGLVVAMDLLRKSTSGKKYGDKRIILFSDLGSPFADDQVEAIVEGLKHLNIQLTVIGPDIEDEDEEDNESNKQDESMVDSGFASTSNNARRGGSTFYGKEKTPQQITGEATLKIILDKVDGDCHSLKNALSTLSFFQKRAIKMTTVFRGPLEIGSKLKINTYSYIKVRAARPDSWKKLSAISEASNQPGDMKVKIERSYHLNDEDETEVEKENLAKGYKYGKTIVPWLKIDEDNMKLKAPKCLSVLGFTKAEIVKRRWYIGEGVVCFMPAPDDEPAAVAFSAFVQALYETDEVAIVRYVYRNNSPPKIGCLIPQIKATHRCLLFIQLPFMEDVRQYAFASLTANKKNVPSAEQFDVIDDLITSMDLSRAYRDEEGQLTEALKPKFTFNPVLQRTYQCIQHRSLNPDDPLPRADPILMSYLDPNQDTVAACSAHCQKIKDLFKLTPMQKRKKRDDGTASSVFKDNIDLELELDTSAKRAKGSNNNKVDIDFSLSSLSKGDVNEIGTVDPVSDFKAMISQRDEDKFEEACKQMRSRIMQLVMESIGSQLFPKAMDCLKVLRRECIRLGEPAMFNLFLKSMKDTIANAFGRNFWFLVVDEGVSLISIKESTESDVNAEVAAMFLKDSTVKVEEAPPDDVEEDADDLLAMM